MKKEVENSTSEGLKYPHLAKIQAAARRVFWDPLHRMAADLDLGELLVMLNKNFGFYSWEAIPVEKGDEIALWVKNNYFRNIQLIDPKAHAALMETENAYSEDFRRQENRVSSERPTGYYP